MANKVEVLLTAKDQASAIVNKSAQNISKSIQDAEKQTKASTSAMLSHWKAMAAGIALTYGVYKTGALVKETALLAARFETLGIVMAQVGKTGGYTADQMNKYDLALRKTGISMIESRSALTKMVQAHLDLSRASELGRVAQDAAVIANINSSDAFGRMVHGIQSGNSLILRNMGIMVDFDQSYQDYAVTLGKTKEQLTGVEKTTARMNAVFVKGKDITGVYEAAMGTAGKKLSSFTRYVEDFKVQMGNAFGPATVILVDAATAAMKQLQVEVSKPEAQQALKDLSLIAAEFVKNLIELSIVMAKIMGMGAEFTNVWIDTWRAMGLASSGVITWSQALKDGTAAVDAFNKGLSIEEIRLLELERIMARTKDWAGVYTQKAYQDAKKEAEALKEIIANRKILAGLSKPEIPLVTPAAKTPIPIIVLSEEQIKAMQEIEAFAIKMSEAEAERIKKREQLGLETVEKFRTARMTEAEVAIDALDKQFLAYDDFVKDKNSLDNWYIGEYDKIFQVEIQQAQDKQQVVNDALEKFRISKMTETEAAIDALGVQFLAYDSFIQDKKALDQWYVTEYDKIINKQTDTMNDAFVGWGRNFSSTLNDMLWGADVTFKSIAESFGKMITQMLIQQEVIAPLFGKGGGGGGLFSTLLGAAGSLLGMGSGISVMAGTAGMATAAQQGIPNIATIWGKGGAFLNGISGYSNQIVNKPTHFAFAKGMGLMGESGAEAIMPLKRTPGGDLGISAEGGGKSTTIIINAIDSKSFAEVVRRNPQSIIAVVGEALEGRTGLLDTIRGTI